MIETGTMVKPEVFNTKNIICAFEATSFLGFTSCICCMALSPIGVAALSNPNIFAAKFIMIEPCAGLFLESSGNKRRKNGPIKRDITPTAPPFSPIFIMPIHKVNTPVKPNEISNPVFDISNVDVIIFPKTSTSPINSKR